MNQRMIASLFILIAATGCGQNIAPSPVQPTDTPTPLPVAGAIAGRVIDAVTRDPIAGANVSTDPPTSTITTGANGGYTLTGIPPGAYTVIAIGEGNIRADAQVTVKAGRLTLADIQLKRTDSTATDAAETHRDVFWPSLPHHLLAAVSIFPSLHGSIPRNTRYKQWDIDVP
jgi:hypothetical protein